MRKSARDIEVGDLLHGFNLPNEPIIKVDKTTTPGVVYLWAYDTTAAQVILNHGESVEVITEDVMEVIDPYTGYPEGTSVCDNCGKVEHTPDELDACLDSMLGPVRPSDDDIYDLTEHLNEAVLAYLNAGLDGVEDQVAQIVKDWMGDR